MLQRAPGPDPRPDDGDSRPTPNRRRANVVTMIFALTILIPSMAGFIMKFYEFVQAFQTDTQGAFAITPMVNYLLASLGFLCLLIWAAWNGMFHDLEAPKQTLLTYDALLDQQEAEERLRKSRSL